MKIRIDEVTVSVPSGVDKTTAIFESIAYAYNNKQIVNLIFNGRAYRIDPDDDIFSDINRYVSEKADSPEPEKDDD